MTTEARNAFRAVLSALTRPELDALADGAAAADPRILQGVTLRPFPIDPNRSAPCVGGCALGFAAWRGNPDADLFGLELRVSQIMRGAAKSHAPGVAPFLAWFDGRPLSEVLPAVAAECRAEQARRDDPGKIPA